MPKICPQCRSEAADDATTCPSCGAALGAAAAAGASMPSAAPPPSPPSGGPAGAGAAAGTAGSSVPAYRFDAARWSLADRIAGIATVVLCISLFLAWFGVSVIGITVSRNGLAVHGFLYIVMILCILIVAYLGLRAGWDELPVGLRVPHVTVMMVATVVNLVLVVIAFADKPGGSGVGWEFGAVLGLIAAVVAAAPYVIPQLSKKTT